MWLIILLITCTSHVLSENGGETENETSRKILGSSVVTSVSVIMDTGNGSKTVFTDAVGRPISKPSSPSDVASPIELLNPDRYEFYTFDDNGDLVKRLMSLKEIKGIIATGDSEGFDLDPYTSHGFVPEKKVNDIVSNVQNVLKEEMEFHKLPTNGKPVFDTPDVSDSWSMILPAVFGNSGHDIKPEKPIAHVTADTIMIEPNMQTSFVSSTSAPEKVNMILSSTIRNKATTSRKPQPSSHTTPRYSSTTAYTSRFTSTPRSTSTTRSTSTSEFSKLPLSSTKYYQAPTKTIPTERPMINVEIISNSKTSTRKPIIINNLSTDSSPLVQIKPFDPSTKKPTTNIVQYSSGQVKPVTVSVKPEPLTSMKPIITSSVESTLSTLHVNKISSPYTTTVKPIEVSLKTESVTPSISMFSIVSKGSTLPTTTKEVQLSTASTSSSEATKFTEQPFVSTAHFEPLSLITVPNLSSNKPLTSTSSGGPLSSASEKVETILTEPYSEITSTENAPQHSTTFAFVENEKAEETTKINENEKTTIRDEDDITSGTENIETIAQKNPTTSANYMTDVPLLHDALSTDQKISASELLDQLLLTTNIYEINTELSQKLPTTQITTTKSNPTTTVLPETTTEQIEISTIKEDVSTDQTLLNSIEQLLSQAVDGVQETIISTGSNQKVHEILANSLNHTMSESIKETATVGSDLIATNKEDNIELTTTEQSTSESEEVITSSSTNNLSQSISSLFSQVSEFSEASITATPLITTETITVKSTSISNRKSEEETTEDTILTSTAFGNTEDAELTTLSSSDDPHLINITIIHLDDKDNLTKVTDSRLEEYDLGNKEITTAEYERDTLKTQSTEELLTTEESSTLRQHTTVNTFDVTTQMMEKFEDTTKKQPEESNEASAITTEFIELFKTTTDLQNNFNQKESETTTLEELNKDFTTTDSLLGITIDASGTSTQTNEETTTIVGTFETTTTLPIESVVTTLKPSAFTSTSAPKKVYKRPDPKPSIEITINENSTYVTENGKPIYPKLEDSQLNKEQTTQKIKEDMIKHKDENTWTLVSTVAPHGNTNKDSAPINPSIPEYPDAIEPPAPIDLVAKPMQGFGLEDSTAHLDTDVYQFAQLCNELAFGFWKIVTGSVSSVRSVFVSPFAATSVLAMVFLGARGATSNEMNEILKLDDMVTFNPHLIFKNVSESIGSDPESGIATSVIIRELFSDRSKGKLLDFYKNRARAFYDGYVEEVGFREIGDVIRRRSNLLVKKYTNGKISEFLKDSSITARPPLAGVSLNIFQTDCTQGSTEGRDGELYFVVLPSIRQRRLVPIPAVVFKSGFLAGYEPSLDATAVALGTKDQLVSTILVIPGQQGIAAPGDGLARLEKRLVESSFKKGAWSRLLRSLIPRPGLEVQIPRFSHRSVINATVTLEKMGLHDLFNADKADLRGLNGVANELHLSDMLQINNFATCGENRIGETHHSEIYPANVYRSRSARFLVQNPSEIDTLEEPRDYQRSFHDPSYNPGLLSLPLSLRPRQARIPEEAPRLKFDRPFLYFVRHNPTGLILHMGRFNPRLLP